MVDLLFAGRARLFTVCGAHRVDERRGHEDVELRSLPFLSFHRAFSQNDHLPLRGVGKTVGGHAIVEGKDFAVCRVMCGHTRLTEPVCPFHRVSATHAGVLVSERRSVSVGVQAAALQGGI